MPYVLTEMPARLPGEPFAAWERRVLTAPLARYVSPVAAVPTPAPARIVTPRATRTRRVTLVTCRSCGRAGAPHKARGLCQPCYLAERRRALGMRPRAPKTQLVPQPCPVCGAPFLAYAMSGGRRQRTCSQGCGQTLRQRERATQLVGGRS